MIFFKHLSLLFYCKDEREENLLDSVITSTCLIVLFHIIKVIYILLSICDIFLAYHTVIRILGSIDLRSDQMDR